jgi:hypothetical protein
MKTTVYKAKQKVPIKNPKRFDILCGQNKTFSKHCGNQVLRSNVVDSVPKYEDISKVATESGRKTLQIKHIKDIVSGMRLKYCSRFLRFDETNKCWFEIEDKEAHTKVSHSLRAYIKKYCKQDTNVNAVGDKQKYPPTTVKNRLILSDLCASPVSMATKFYLDLDFNETATSIVSCDDGDRVCNTSNGDEFRANTTWDKIVEEVNQMFEEEQQQQKLCHHH